MENRASNQKEQYVIYGFIILAVIAVGFTVFNYLNRPSLFPAKNYDTITTGTTAEGDVEISLTPSVDRNQIIITAVLNTHSVDLSQFDLQKSVQLAYGSKTIFPRSAFTLSGHHASGQILFDVGKYINSFTITVSGVSIIPERVYSWR